MIEMSVLQHATFSLGALGSVLGVVNTWVNLDRGRMKLKIVPSQVVPVGNIDPRIGFAIQITNLSNFPVSVSEAGVLDRGSQNRGSIFNPLIADGGDWPRRLEPRSSVTV
jgi:hypothetical protein